MSFLLPSSSLWKWIIPLCSHRREDKVQVYASCYVQPNPALMILFQISCVCRWDALQVKQSSHTAKPISHCHSGSSTLLKISKNQILISSRLSWDWILWSSFFRQRQPIVWPQILDSVCCLHLKKDVLTSTLLSMWISWLFRKPTTYGFVFA